VGLRAVCYRQEDIGKALIVRGMRSDNIPFEWSVKLAIGVQESPFSVLSIDPRGGVIKDPTCGRVTLAEDNGRLLGLYEPDETVPAYRRIKITGLPDDCAVVNLRCARRYFPLYGDDDVVETDNQPAWDDMARYLRIHLRADRSPADIQAENNHLTTAKAHMEGDQSRDIGKATQSEVTIATPYFMGRHGGLIRNRRGRWWA
jgi:hypothetical protein